MFKPNIALLHQIFMPAFSYCFALFNSQSLHQPAELLPCDGPELALISGPLEGSVLKPLVEKDEAGGFPHEHLDAVTLLSAEDEESRSKGIHVELLLYNGCKTVDGLAHVCVSAGYVYVLGNADVA